MAGAKFRRQHGIGPYIVDFYCAEALLVIEADGAHHYPPPDHDIRRDNYLHANGITVLRFKNTTILEDTSSVLRTIDAALAALRPVVFPPSPASGEGAGG